MGEPPCDALAVELALDRLDGALAVELPAHMRAFAKAYGDGRSPPGAPSIARAAATLATARAALRHDVLAERGLALLRWVAAVAIEDDPRVRAARATAPSWEHARELAAARDAAARARFGCGALALDHALAGVADGSGARACEPVGAAIDGWNAAGPRATIAEIAALATRIAARFGVDARRRIAVVAISPGSAARPRAFVIEPRREVAIAVPAIVETPAARFAVLHEIGHAVAALIAEPGLPRAVDEAAAAHIASANERTDEHAELPAAWTSSLAAAARARRTRLAAALDRVERALYAGNRDALATARDALSTSQHGAELPLPPALWHDTGAQAAYVEAEAIAARWRDVAPADWAARLRDEHARADAIALAALRR